MSVAVQFRFPNYTQSALTYPTAVGSSEQDILEAARSRAQFWKYPTNGPWCVCVTLGKRDLEVRCNAEGETTIAR